jgi:hypothetical protein
MRNRVAGMILMLAAAGGALSAAEKTKVDVYLNGHDDSEEILGPAKVLVSGIYDQIGVRLVWHAGELPERRENFRPAFAIRTAEHPLESATSEALASARIVGSSGAEIVIYKDRLERLLAGHRTIANVAAAYVLAHELAHVMQGVARHSEAGILKAHWGEDDYHEMAFHKLVFTAADVDLIHRGLAVQQAAAADTTNSF